MTENNKVFTGLDICTTTIRAVVGMPNQMAKMTLLATAEVPSEGVVGSSITNIDKTVRNIKQVIQKVSKEANVQITTANVSLSGKHIKTAIHHTSITRESTQGEITQLDIEQLHEEMYRIHVTQGYNVVDIVPIEYEVDYEENVQNPIGMSGTYLKGAFHVISVQTNVLNNLYKCVQKAGVKISNLILSPLASSLAVLTQEEKEAGVCMVEIGASNIGINIYHNSGLRYIALIPIGGQHITKDISEAFMLREIQAEKVKVTFGSAYEQPTKNEIIAIPGLSNRPLKEIFLPVINRVIEARMEEIIQLIYREIITSGLQNKLPGGIVLTGGVSKLKETLTMVNLITNYDTRIGYPYECLQSGIEMPDISFSTCIGLVLANYKSLGSPKKYYLTKEIKSSNQLIKKRKKKSIWASFSNIFR